MTKKYKTSKEVRERANRWYQDNREKRLASLKEQYSNDEEFRRKKRDKAYRAAYGISLEEYEQFLKEQDGVCAGCGESDIANRRLSIDHCHKSNQVRGLLCIRCNRLLGLAKDDPKILKQLIEYLYQHQTKEATDECD